jgi:MFS family permease
LSKGGALLFSRRLLPLLAVQSLSALADTLFKAAAVMMAVYAAGSTEHQGALIPAVVWALFMLPYVLFAGLAGQLADKFQKARLLRWLRVFDVAVMGLAAAGFLRSDIPLLLVAVFFKGVTSALFSPVKYTALPELVDSRELGFGYAVNEAATFVACLVGTLAGALVPPTPEGHAAAAAGLVLVSAAALICAAAVPRRSAALPSLKLQFHPLRPLGEAFRQVAESPALTHVMLGRALFWLTGALFLAEIPGLTRYELGGRPEVVALLFGLFSVGIAAGMIGCYPFATRAAARHVWAPGLLISGLILDICLSASRLTPPAELLPLASFLSAPGRLRITAELALVAVLCGMFVAPLGVSLQALPAPQARARVTALDNAASSLVIVLGMAGATLSLAAGAQVTDILMVFAAANAAACLHLRFALRRTVLA